MPGDPLTDAAACASAALAEFGRLVAAQPAAGADPQAALAEMKADIAILRGIIRDEFVSLRRLIERLAERLESPHPIVALNREAEALMRGPCAPPGDSASPSDASPPPRRRWRGARTPQRERVMRILWAQPETEVSQRQMVARLNTLPGIEMTLGGLQQWAMDIGLPYRDPRLAQYRQQRVPRVPSLLSAEELAELEREIAGGAAATAEAPQPPAVERLPAAPVAAAPPRKPRCGAFTLSAAPTVQMDIPEVERWAKANGITFAGPHDVRRINVLRERRGEGAA